MKSIKAIFRRGQNTKIEGQNLGDNLSRASSVTNLDAEPKSGKGARPRKSSSRDRIDKIGESRKNDKKGIIRNNNKLDSGENPYPSVDSLSEEELSHLRRQLQDMAQEKTNLALQLGEHKGQLNILQKEIQKLKEESNIQLEHLTEENTTLRNRLRDVAHSPLSDNEKQQLLFDSHRHHSSAPASIATNIIDDGNGGDTTCTTPDWDKHSSSNVSEVSVACLQDKINQMQETHYSTNEELQATLQELTDLQRQLTELQQENERLNEEKTLMFDSLCRQTERLNDSRSEVESLKQLLYQEKDDTGQFESAVEREQKLVDLLKSAQEEREGLLVKLDQLNNELQDARTGIIEKDEQIAQLRDRVRTLECTLDAKHAEHKLLDQELAQAKDQCSGKQIEINRLTDLLDNARTKINELEQDRALSDKSELDELLDNARKEKDSLESEVAHLKEQLAISKNEIEKFREQISILQEECKVTRNNAKTTQSDLEYKCEKLVKDKNVLNEQLQEFQEALNELQVQSQCQLEDKRQLSAVLSETQRNLSESERKNLNLESEVDELKKQRAEESEEWEKFQDDLLTSVRVANDFKTEAQQELQRIILENKQFRDRERQLKAELDKLKGRTLKSSNKENQDMDVFIKRPNRNKDKLRKNSGTVSSSSKSDKTPPASQPGTVKRRENKSLKAKRFKTLSVEEEMLLKSLDSYHADIDKTIPDEFLTEEQKVIRKLKIIYEDDYLKVKPVAPKPKDQLAISKPLLDSVLTNPKLMAILKNPKVKTIEDIASFEKEAPEIRNIIRDIDRSLRGKSDCLTRPENIKRISIIGRSMSLDQVHEVETMDKKLRLYRTVETEDLTEEGAINVGQRVSSLVPSDSVSNYNKRYSDFAVVANKNSSENIFNQHVKYSTLERIVKSIPKNAPESKLTNEQRFALKLLTALEERKNTLKKSDKAKTLPISKPTEESVLKNPKLKEIIYDPDIQDVPRRKSDAHTRNPPVVEKTLRPSKSYDNIIFTFDQKHHTINMYNSPSETSSETFSSAEFNVETSEVGPYNENSFSSTWRRPVPTPKLPRNMELVSFSETKSFKNEDKTKIKGVRKTVQDIAVITNKVPSKKEKNPNKIVGEEKQSLEPVFIQPEVLRRQKSKDRDKHVDSLLYNEILNKKLKDSPIEASLKVDLLQEKIKKITKKEKLPVVDDKVRRKAKTNNDHFLSNTSYPAATGVAIEHIVRVKESPKYQTPVLHFATIETIDVSRTDEPDSLVYNETLERALKRHTSGLKDQKNTLETTPVPDVNEAIKNITEKFQEIRKLIDEDKERVDLTGDKERDKKEDNKESYENSVTTEDDKAVQELSDLKPDLILNVEEKISEPDLNIVKPITLENVAVDTSNLDDDVDASQTFDEAIDEIPDQSPEYNYREILKENRVGVTTPLNYRLSYRDVVKEFKKKFSADEQQIQDAIKDFEETNNQLHPELDVQIRKDSNASIDKEMEHIFEHYLKTRVSQIIKQTESKSKDITVNPETENEDQLDDSNTLKNTVADKDVTTNFDNSDSENGKLDISLLSKSYGFQSVVEQPPKNENPAALLSPVSENEMSKTENVNTTLQDFDYSKLSPKQLTFSDDSYFELKDGSVKNIRAFALDLDQKSAGASTKNIDQSIKEESPTNPENQEFTTYMEFQTKNWHSPEQKDVRYPDIYKTLVVTTDVENNIKNLSEIHKKVQDTIKVDVSFEERNKMLPTDTSKTEKVNENIEKSVLPTIYKVTNDINHPASSLAKYPCGNNAHEARLVLDQKFTPNVDQSDTNENIPNFIEEDRLSLELTHMNNVSANTRGDLKDENTEGDISLDENQFIPPGFSNMLVRTIEPEVVEKDTEKEKSNIQIVYDPSVPTVSLENEKSLLQEHFDQSKVLTEDEMNIIHRIKNETFSRPVSGLNYHDLELIQSLSLNYLNDDRETKQIDLIVDTESNRIADEYLQNVDKISDTKIITESTADAEELIRTSKRQYSRPLSDFNQEDVDLISKLSKDYLQTGEVQDEVNRNASENDKNISEKIVYESVSEDLENLSLSPVSRNTFTNEQLPSTSTEPEKINSRKSRTLPVVTTDLPDDLETLLGKMSSSRSRVTKKRLNKTDQNIKPNSSLQTKDEQDEEKITARSIVNEETSAVKDTANVTTDLEGEVFNIVVKDEVQTRLENPSEGNVRKEPENKNTDIVKIQVGVISTNLETYENRVDNQNKEGLIIEDHSGLFKNIRKVDDNKKYDDEHETSVKKEVITNKSLETDIRNLKNDIVQEEREVAHVDGVNNLKINEAGTLEKRTERHVILYRNKPTERKNIKSLNLETDIGAANSDSSKQFRSLSPRPKSDMVQLKTEKRVKSFAQHFERLSHERGKKAEPVYVNTRLSSKVKHPIPLPPIRKTIEKKPLPVPRLRNQVAKDFDASDSYSDDRHTVMKNMSGGNKNYSEIDNDHLAEEIASSVATVPKTEGLPGEIEKASQEGTVVLELGESQNIILADQVSDSTEDEDGTEPKAVLSKTGIEKSGKFTDKMQLLTTVENLQEQHDEGGGAAASYSVIAIVNTAEKLDLRTPSETVINPTNKTNVSKLNLFNLEGVETPGVDESYVGVFKSVDEDGMLSELARKKMIGYDITYLGELSDTESFEEPKLSLEGESQSKPKIVDFVPLDDATKPFFNNSNSIPDYNTLEREKVYHVLNSASKAKVTQDENTKEPEDHAEVTESATNQKTIKKPEEPKEDKSPSERLELVMNTGSKVNVKTRKDEDSEKPKSDDQVDLVKDQIKITAQPQETLTAARAEAVTKSSSKSNVDLTTEHATVDKKSMFSSAKKVFEDLEAKNFIKISPKEYNDCKCAESVISGAESNISSTEEVELTNEEIDKEI